MLPIAILVPLGAALFLVGLGLIWRRVDRSQRQSCRAIAKDLTDKVHDRCDAYRRLEAQITGIVSEFDKREAEIRGERHATERSGAAAAAAAAAAAKPACGVAGADSCEAACKTLSAGSKEGLAAGSTPEGPAPVEHEIEQFARRLQDTRIEDRVAIERQRSVIESLEQRIRRIETSGPGLERPAPEARAPHESLGGLGALAQRFDRVDQEILATLGAVHELASRMSPHALAHPAGLAPCSSCERARELARQILALRPGTVEAATLRPVPMPAPYAPAAPAAPLAPLAPAATGFDPDGKLAELSRSLVAKQRELERIQDSYRHVVDANQRMSTDLAERESRLNQVQAQIDSLRGDLSSAGQRLDTNKSQITSLMQSLEVTKDEAANHQRMLNEQSAQFSAAHSMLHRLGPLLQALETEATATARPPGRPT